MNTLPSSPSASPISEETQPALPASVDKFLRFIQHEKRLSLLTARFYRDELIALFTSLPIAPERLSERALRRLITEAHAKGQSPRTLARRLSAWRSYFNYLVLLGEVTDNPVKNIRPPKGEKKLPNTLSVEQMGHLLTHRADKKEAHPIWLVRDRALFELSYSSGLRVSEVVSLNVAHLRAILRGEVEVLGKRQKTRLVPVGKSAIEAIRQWVSVRNDYLNTRQAPPMSRQNLGQQPLFINAHGQRMTVRMVQRHLTIWAKEAQLPMHVHPHMLRHSFASHVLQSSADLRAVQEMLGHASLASTQVYTHLNFSELAQVYDGAHPRARRSHKPQ